MQTLTFRSLSVLGALLMTVAMLAGVRAGFTIAAHTAPITVQR